MRIAFTTTLGKQGSSIIGRVIPLAQELSQNHEVHVLLLEPVSSLPEATSQLKYHSVGTEPFQRSSEGKKRLKGLTLLMALVAISFRTARTLHSLKPDRVIIAKTLPHNVFGVWLWQLFNRKAKI